MQSHHRVRNSNTNHVTLNLRASEQRNSVTCLCPLDDASQDGCRYIGRSSVASVV